MKPRTRLFALSILLLVCTALPAGAEDDKKEKTPQVYPAAVLPFQSAGGRRRTKVAKSPICFSPSWRSSRDWRWWSARTSGSSWKSRN